jgi:hypothetical protein
MFFIGHCTNSGVTHRNTYTSSNQSIPNSDDCSAESCRHIDRATHCADAEVRHADREPRQSA